MGSYVPHTQEERKEMLKSIGLKSTKDLFAHIPSSVHKYPALDLPSGKSELEVRRAVEEMAAKNKVFQTIFRGAGAYNHYIPATVKAITTREEFLTAYTPYQAEISQGVLQSIFEYQTMICELTGMETSNASLYDGATASAEAVAMCRDRKRSKAIVSAAVHPDVLETIQTYAFAANAEIVVAPEKNGVTDLKALGKLLDDSICCVLIQQPSFFGQFEDADKIGEMAHAAGAKFIMNCNPMALAISKTPREYGADVAVGEGQPLGMPLSFGGPYLGYMAATSEMTRKLPGRIVGQTVDAEGKRAFVLTLQAREQHIRREKASSNVCSNEALCAMTASVYMATMGPEGMAEAASQCHSKAAYAAKKITALKGYNLKFKGEFFHEFVTTCPDAKKALAKLERNGILGGLPLSGAYEGCILWCVTEMNTKDEIDRLVALLKEVA